MTCWSFRTRAIVAAAVVAFVVLLAFMIAPNPADPDDDGDPFTGQWLVNGVTAQEVEYSGTLSIVADGAEYELQWLITGAFETGRGSVDNGVLEAVWSSATGIGPDQTGTARYTLDDRGHLLGVRTIDGIAGSGTEEGFPPT